MNDNVPVRRRRRRQIKKNEMAKICTMHREQAVHIQF
jgi:hypothetical protein